MIKLKEKITNQDERGEPATVGRLTVSMQTMNPTTSFLSVTPFPNWTDANLGEFDNNLYLKGMRQHCKTGSTMQVQAWNYIPPFAMVRKWWGGKSPR
ncbi:MAG: hypothetical protein IPP73_04905 [Chitinophagaceae bacterium]|nr:hypothetical protein [Chitinophagaceae bacterium]